MTICEEIVNTDVVKWKAHFYIAAPLRWLQVSINLKYLAYPKKEVKDWAEQMLLNRNNYNNL